MPICPIVRHARYDRIVHGIPQNAYLAYCSQIHSSRQRGVGFEFTLLEWWGWWQIDGRWAKRGRKRGCIMMARIADAGPYALGNVYAASHKQNSHDAKSAVSAGLTAHWAAKTPEGRARWHLAVRGDGHPKSKPVIDPDGKRFGSAASAAEAHYYTRQYIAYLARKQIRGWRWA